MTGTRAFMHIVAAGLCASSLAGAAARADDFDIGEKPAASLEPGPTNWITLGAQYQSGPSDYLNRYTGAVSPGFYGLGEFHYLDRDPWDSSGTTYYSADAWNLGFQDRYIELRAGRQGTWGAYFSYSGIPYYAGSLLTFYQPHGTLVPSVPPGSLGIRYTQLLPAVGRVNSLFFPTPVNPPTGLASYNLNTLRDVFDTGGKYQFGQWKVNSGWRHEHKEGTQLGSLPMGGTPNATTAGTGAAAPTTFTSALVYFAMPIDYDTDRFDVTMSYGGPDIQAQLGYTFTNFNDNGTVFNAQNPYNFFSPTLAATFGGPASGITAPYTLPPSNSAHQIRGQLGYNLADNVRLNVNAGYGFQMQNDPFTSGIGNVTPAPGQPLPRSSFDGLVQNSFFNAAITANPAPKWDLRFAYTFDDRNNESPRNTYNVFPVSALATSFNNYSNLPFSYLHQVGEFDAGYRVAPRTKISVTDTMDFTERNYTNTSLVTSNRIFGKIRGPVVEDVYGSFSIGHEDRWASNYNAQGWWQQLCNGCNVEPSNLLMFFESSRKRDELKATVDIPTVSAVTASLIAKVDRDTYPANNYGLRNNYNFTTGPDVAWQVTEAITTHAFYNYQQIYYNTGSIYQSPNPPAIPAPTPTNTNFSVPWNMKTTDHVHTVGLNTDWQAIPDLLKVSLDYNLSYGDTAYALGEGAVAVGGAQTSPTLAPSLAIQPLPDVKSLLSVLSLHGEYSFTSNLTFLAGYAWEYFRYKDFLQNAQPLQFGNALLPGVLVPNESIHVVSAGMRFRF
jgi:MtrB/PioB family decaheme-associated outer membrane protein